MNKVVLLFVCVLLTTQDVQAEGGFQLKSSDLLVNKVFDLNNSNKLHVVIHDKGHLQGMSYVVDLRPSCNDDKKTWKELETLDVKSACAVDINSLKINDDRTELSINIHNASAQSYEKQMKKGIRNVQPECEKKAVKHTFSLKDFCS